MAGGSGEGRQISAGQRREGRGQGVGGVGNFAGQHDDYQTGSSFRGGEGGLAKEATGRHHPGWEQLRPLGRASQAARWRTGGKIAGDTSRGKKRAKRAKKRAKRAKKGQEEEDAALNCRRGNR